MRKAFEAPSAKKIETKLSKHDHIRIDNYFWLNDRENPEVIDYLNAENDYLKQEMAHTEGLQIKLFEEMKARIKEDDESVPYELNGYWYLTKFEKGKDYPIYLRKKESLEADAELLFDCNKMAEGHSYFKLSSITISPDNRFAAFGTDTVSRRLYTIQIKNLSTGEILSEKITNTTGNAIWANDNKTLFYTRKDVNTLRSDKVYRHKLHTDIDADILIYHEKDDTFFSNIYKTKSKKYLVIACHSSLSDEYRILDTNNPDGQFEIFTQREPNIEYDIHHHDDTFYMVTNADNAVNFKLMKCHENFTQRSNWQEIIPHRRDTLLQDIDVFQNYLVVSERFNGLSKILVKPWESQESYYLPFESETYTAFTTTNLEFDTNMVRYGYTSLTTPNSVVDFDMKNRTKKILKMSEVPDGKFDSANYQSERVWANASDGKKIAISLVYRKGLTKNGENPLLLYAYGSYGSTVNPGFNRAAISLLDRGFIFAIAHIRGGQYLGREWYEDGRLLNKINTFTDFIDCSKYLIAQNYTSPKHHYALGGSAGGLLMGAIINMAPELYNGVIAAVPFVDVVTTMLDNTIPLTTFEYDEWGNPNSKSYYDYVLSYSPYDQVVANNYPHMLVTTGLHDSQVQYWEPAKWVAKLRELKSNNNILLMKVDMKSGHGGASGRFESLKEDALEYAFLLDLEGIIE